MALFGRGCGIGLISEGQTRVLASSDLTQEQGPGQTDDTNLR